MQSLLSLFFVAALICAGLIPGAVFAQGSVIVESRGTAAMGDSLSIRETENQALAEAKRNASELASTFVRSQTTVKNYVTEEDLVEAFSQAMVKILEELENEWFTDPVMGRTYSITVRAEVTPYTRALEEKKTAPQWMDDPQAPLTVSVWSDKASYRQGETMTLYLKGNKPFFARVLYINSVGEILQVLPNPYRNESYFQGGVIYSLPSGLDNYSLRVAPPLGREEVIVYASTSPLGGIELTDYGPVFRPLENQGAMSAKTRAIVIEPKAGPVAGAGAQSIAAQKAGEFFEARLELETLP